MRKWLKEQLSRFRQQQHHHPERKEFSTVSQCHTLPLPPPPFFELLPDEILLEIFEYILYLQLYHGFVNLNARINAILRDLRIVIGASLFFDNAIDEDVSKAIQYFAPQIVKMTIGRCPSLDLTRFSNLRSLDFYAPTLVQLESISPQFMPKLIHIRFGSIQPGDQSILHAILFPSPATHQFSSLQQCDFFELSFTYLTVVSPVCCAIHTLSISRCTPNEFFRFLSQLPNLIRFRTRNLIETSFTIDNIVAIQHNKLVDLHLGFIWIHDSLFLLNRLLLCVPNVDRCQLRLSKLTTIHDFQHLERILIERLPHLRKFNCSIEYFYPRLSEDLISQTMFEQVRNSLFLFENKTKFRLIDFCNSIFSIKILLD